MPMYRRSRLPSWDAAPSIPAVKPFRPVPPVGVRPPVANDDIVIAAQLAAHLPWPQFFRRMLPWIGYGLTAYAAYEMWSKFKTTAPALNGWRVVNTCYSGATGYDNAVTASCAIGGLQPGQVYPVTPITFPYTGTFLRSIDIRPNNGEALNPPYDRVLYPGTLYQRITGAPSALYEPVANPVVVYGPDANVVRNTPGQIPEPEPGVAPAPGYAQEPQPPRPSEVEPPPLPDWIVGPGVGVPVTPGIISQPPAGGAPFVPAPDVWQWTPPGQGMPTPHVRQPPPKGTKEKKVQNNSARLGKAIYDAVDNISEKAEIVDALYKALPEDVRKRWEKKVKRRGIAQQGRDRGFADQFGQYGIAGADWKMEAIWYNYHRLDGVEAVRNIVKNHVEDLVIGKINAVLPRNVGSAFTRDYTEVTPWGETVDKQWSPELEISNIVDNLFNKYEELSGIRR